MPHRTAGLRCVPDGVIASGSSDGTIALSGVGDGNLVMRLPLGSDSSTASALPAVNALAFSSGSRYLCSASGSGLTIWDLKKHEKTRRLAGHAAGSTVLALDFGAADQHVASASNRGEVIVHNLATGGIGCRFHAEAALTGDGSGGVALRDLQHSPHKKHMLALCGDAGVVELWDCNTTSSIVTLRPPQTPGGAGAIMPLSALRFSPTSEALFASVGLDKRLCFWDVNSRKCIRDIPTDYPLTALDYHKDGVTLVVGTSAGHLLLYDIRNASKPSAKILQAHAGRTVNAVKFGHAGIPIPTQVQQGAAPPKTSAAAAAAPHRGPSAPSSSSSVFDAKSAPHIDMNPTGLGSTRNARAPAAAVEDHNATVPPALNHTTASGVGGGFNPQNQTVPMSFGAHAGGAGSAGDLFSPIKGDLSSATTLHSPFGTAGGPGFQPSHLHAQGLPHQQQRLPLAGGFVSPAQQGHSNTMLFSPIAGSNGSAAAAASPIGANTASAAPPAHLTSNFNSAAAAARPGAKGQPAKRGGSVAASDVSGSAADAFTSFDPSAAAMMARAAAAEAAAFGAASSSAASSADASAVAASPRARPSQPMLMPSPHRGGGGSFGSNPAASASSSDVPGFGAAAGGANEYQVALLRSMLDDSLYSLRSEMRAQISDLHVEMLKQFHAAQLDQSRALDAFMARFEKAVEEVRELREDYKQLKHIY